MSKIKNLTKKFLPQSAFSRAVSILAGGNAIGQLVALVASPLLTRLYSPSEFGILAVYMSLTGILGVIVCLRYEFAIPLPKCHTAALNVALLSTFCAVLTASITLTFICLYRSDIASYFKLPELHSLLLVVPLSVLLIGLFKTSSMWCVRTHKFSLLGKIRIYQVLASVLVQLSSFSLGSLGLILGQLANQGAGTKFLFKNFVKTSKPIKLNVKACYRAAKEHWRLPLLSTWASLANKTSSQLPALMLAALFSPAIAGLYALAIRVVTTPGSMIGGAVQKVFLATAAKSHRDGTLPSLFSKTLHEATMLVGPCTALLAMIIPFLFDFFFGENWKTAGQFGQALLIITFCQIVISPLMPIYTVLGKQRIELTQQILQFTLRFSAIWIGYKLGAPLISVILYSIASAIGYVIFLLWAHHELNLRIRDYLPSIIKSIFASGLICAPISLADNSLIELDTSLSIVTSCLLLITYLYIATKRLF